jgi:hypothetical protein
MSAHTLEAICIATLALSGGFALVCEIRTLFFNPLNFEDR